MNAKMHQKTTRIIAVINQKGGVGKTTSTLNIGAGLSRKGLKILLVDLDAQAHLTDTMGIAANDLVTTVYHLLKGDVTADEALITKNSVDVIPASIELTEAEISLSSVKGRENLLKNGLINIPEYDVILFDCPPNLGLLTLNALTAAKEIFVPLQSEYLSLKGLNKLMDMVDRVKKRINPDLAITGIFTTLFDKRLKLHNEVFAHLHTHFHDILFRTQIRRNVALAEAGSFGKSIFDYAPSSMGAKDYERLCKEIIERG